MLCCPVQENSLLRSMGRGRPKSDLVPGKLKAEPKHEKLAGALALQEAPVFYPTEEEFQDPLQYIAQIRPEAENYGICRIIPPKSWDPPFALDPQKFSFPTKLQAIHQLQERPAACDAETFKLEYGRYLQKEGRSLESWPTFDGEELDLCKLFNAVKRHGGFEKVKQERKWVEVIRMVRPKTTLSSLCMQSSAGASVILCQLYEKYLASYEHYQSNAGLMKQSRTPRRPEAKVKCKGKRGIRTPSQDDAETDEVSGLGRKRQLQEGDVDTFQGGIECDVLDQADLSPDCKRPKLEEDVEDDSDYEGRTDQYCEQCNSGAHEQMMLLCDRCDRGWHLYCLSPPLTAVPRGNWYCLDCISSERDSFGFSQGQKHSLESFRRMADRFKRKWFGTSSISYPELEKEFWRVVERATAPVEVLYGSDLDVSTFGSGFPRTCDTDAELKDNLAWETHANSPWNLNNFPKLKGSMLRLVDDNIPGVIVPWLYVGMLFSSFCWHYEDHCFYSVNYLHWGEPKTWYSVPGSAAEAFEQVMRKTFPDLFEAQPDLLFQLVTMLNPVVLRDSGVPVCTTVQEPRNFVITFPKSYHGGFNHGFNCAEAVNFAPVDWLPYGGFAVERYRLYHKSAVLSHDELLCVVAKNDSGARTYNWLEEELARIVSTERSQREQLWKAGVIKSSRMASRKSPEHVGTEEDPECIICRYYLHLSAVVCKCRPGKAVCLQHARQLCECSTHEQHLTYRYTLAELDDLVNGETVDCKLEETLGGPRTSRRKPRGLPTVRSPLASPLIKKVKGRLVKHAELAEAWAIDAKTILKQCPRLSEVEDLLAQAEQFLWAGHEMDQVRELESQLSAACKWAQDIAACTSAVERRLQAAGPSKLPRVSFVLAQHLVSVEPQCVDENLAKLKGFVKTACSLQEQIHDALKSSPSLEVRNIQSLYQEALRCPFEIPELQQLKDTISHAQNAEKLNNKIRGELAAELSVTLKGWSERARKLLPTGKGGRNRTKNEFPDLHQLRSLQCEGQQIRVVVGEKCMLDSLIKEIEGWQVHANRLLQGAASLQQLEEVLVEAECFPVQLPEIELLETRIGKARDWVFRAQQSLSEIQQPDDYNVSIKLLQDLIAAGEMLDVYAVMEVKVVQTELLKLSWMYSASKALLELPTTRTVADLLADATRLELPESTVLSQIRELAGAASVWESKAKYLLQHGASMDEFNKTISAANDIQVAMSGLVELKSAVQKANEWLGRAKQVLLLRANGSVTESAEPLQVAVLQAVVADSKDLSVRLNEVEQLATILIDVEAWISKVDCIKGLAKAELGVCEANVETISRMEGMVKKIGNMVKDGLALGYKFSEVAELECLSYRMKWNIKAGLLLLNEPSIKEVRSLLAEGRELPACVGNFERLKSALSVIEAWLSATALVLPTHGSKVKLPESQLEKLISEAQNFDPALHRAWSPELARLQKTLSDHRTWQKEVRHVLSGNVLHLSWSELTRLQAIGQANPVENKEMELLNAELVEGGLWISRCFKAIVGRSSCGSFSLQEVLMQMHKSVENALQQLGTRDTRESIPFSCVCQETLEDSSNNILRCDSCEDWYHPTCVGLAQAQTRGQRLYVCPFCTAICTGVLTLNDDVYAKMHVTRRPTLALLRELLSAARSIRCRMHEKDFLEGVIRLVEAWQARVHEIVGPALVQYNFGTEVDSHGLLAALKAVGAMEVQDDEGVKIKTAVAANAWRVRARKLLDGPSKPCLRPLSRAVKEGLAIPVPVEDIILKNLRQLEAYASNWAARAKEATGDLGEMPVSEVYALIAEGERLPVAFTKEIAALKVRSILYCICQKPYDEDRAMIACDRCSEWYHFSCINLPEPDGGEDSSDDVCDELGEFICFNCQERCQGPPDESNMEHDPSRNVGLGVEDSAAPPVVRGKRSSRNGSSKSKSGLQQKWGHIPASNSLHCSSQKANEFEEAPENSVSPSGRPCRRTAGRHSGFESFVLLNVRSR